MENRFLSTSTGFRYLYALGYVQKEMDDWFEVNVLNDMEHVQKEINLLKYLFSNLVSKSSICYTARAFAGESSS